MTEPESPTHLGLKSLLRQPSAFPERVSLDWLTHVSDSQLVLLLDDLRDAQRTDPIHEGLLAEIFRQLVRRVHQHNSAGLSADSRHRLVQLYGELGPQGHARCLLLQILAAGRQPEDLGAFVSVVTNDPPADRKDVGLAFSPLFQQPDYDPQLLFPRLLGAICHPSVAAPIIDLSNYLTREGHVDVHPAAQRREELLPLLGQLVQRLAKLSEAVDVEDHRLRETAQVVEDGVALAVALCDACALIGDIAATGKLRQAMELRHRRVRTEAAAALARLGDAEGREALCELAAEPVCRLRVLAYAEELGFLDQIAQEYQTHRARAEADLALWLAQPAQVGIPPARFELVDERVQYWPGWDDPVECYLFRFVYPFANGEFSNIGLAGPLTHAFAADLSDLGPDDIYAVFAGHDAEHEEIAEYHVAELSEPSRVEATRLERRLRDEGFSVVECLRLGSFFGDRYLVARVRRDSSDGIAVADARDVLWCGSAGRSRPLGASEVSCLYKGRKLLRSFNP